MTNVSLIQKNHKGVILDIGNYDSWDAEGVAFCCAFSEPEDAKRIFLFYTGTKSKSWHNSAIGLATSSDGYLFTKQGKGPVFEGQKNSFCNGVVSTPAVFRFKNRYWMIFSGRRSKNDAMRLGLASADDPTGPWELVRELIRPKYFWEGCDIDNGPGIMVLGEEIFAFYSNITITYIEYVHRWLERLRRRARAHTSLKAGLSPFYPLWLQPGLNRELTPYMKRRIGMLKLRINGIGRADVEVYRCPWNPLTHLSNSLGSWNESSFCPGYIKIGDAHLMFTANSSYSVGYPYRQYVGVAQSNSPAFPKEKCRVDLLINGPSEKFALLAPIQPKSEVALDTPSPLIDPRDGSVHLYYAIMDRSDNVWRVASTQLDVIT